MRLTHLVLALGLIACSGRDTSEPTVSLAEGTWSGAITGDAQDGTLLWTLTDTDGEINGQGTLSTATVSVPLTMEGTYDAPSLSLAIHPEGYEDISFAGTVTERTIKGRMTGAGLINRTVTLDRQP